ncbi:hypothetical protein HQK29_16870 [Vibrio vulnificus]|nr:hypothetical protein [Vibrio vulnificus]
MNSIELIRKLSDNSAADFYRALSCINPIPFDAKDIIPKIDISIQRIDYGQNRQGGEGPTQDSDEKIERLRRLKQDIERLLD